jgi:cyanophycinase
MGAIASVAGEFAEACGGAGKRVALLLQGSPRMAEYLANYINPLKAGGLSVEVIASNNRGDLDIQTAVRKLREADGVFVGGGHTITYRGLYADSEVGEVIRDLYENGRPYAGLSAGAVIAMQHCIPDEEGLAIMAGLGLLKNELVAVHYSEQKALTPLIRAMRNTGLQTAWAMDETGCAVFENEVYSGMLGNGVYRVRLLSLSGGSFTIQRMG